MIATLVDITKAVEARLQGIEVTTMVEGGTVLTPVRIWLETTSVDPDRTPTPPYILIQNFGDFEADTARRESHQEFFDEDTGLVSTASEPFNLTFYVFAFSVNAKADHQLMLFLQRKLGLWSAVQVGDEWFDTKRIGFIPLKQDKEDQARFARCFAFQVLIDVDDPDTFFAVEPIAEVVTEIEVEVTT